MLSAARTSPAGFLIIYFFLPLAVAVVPLAFAAAVRWSRNATARAVALAEQIANTESRFDTQDRALTQLLTVISPGEGQPSLLATLARMDAEAAADRKALEDHVRHTEQRDAEFIRRLEALTAAHP